jgi:hypothetical protein
VSSGSWRPRLVSEHQDPAAVNWKMRTRRLREVLAFAGEHTARQRRDSQRSR